MKRTEHLILPLRQKLQHHTDVTTKTWWENYVKGSAPFMGVKMPVIRTLVKEWYKETIKENQDVPEPIQPALTLLKGKYTEEKLAGILLLQEFIIPEGRINLQQDITLFEDMFDNGYIYDWNVCDWFCMKVLGPLIQINGMPVAKRMTEWHSAENVWRARASVVAFVKVAGESIYYPSVRESCRVLAARKERFAKTAVGWILREISKYNESFTCQVIKENIQHFTTESLRNATKYFTREQKERYKKMLKEYS